MILHIVLFNLKSELAESNRDKLFDQIKGLSKIPSAKRLSISNLLEPRAEWYRSRTSTEYGWALTMEFDNEDGLYEYQQHPDHVTVAQEIRKNAANIKVMDFVSL